MGSHREARVAKNRSTTESKTRHYWYHVQCGMVSGGPRSGQGEMTGLVPDQTGRGGRGVLPVEED